MENKNNHQLTSQPKQYNEVALHTNEAAKTYLDNLLLACFSVQKMYGRAPANFDKITAVFHNLLGKFPGDKAIKGFETWMERSQEFPTPADIIGLIRRNGKPPIKESDIIAIRRKEICDWTRDEADMVEDWKADQNESWGGLPDSDQEERLQQEIQRLRLQVAELRKENARAWSEAKILRQHKGIEKPSLSQQEKINRTVQAMQVGGAPQADIDEFLRSA